MKPWETAFIQARAALVAFQDAETAWLQSLGDPRLYRSDRGAEIDRYLAIFPPAPLALSVILGQAIAHARAGLDHITAALALPEYRRGASPLTFPFAQSKCDYFGTPHQERIAVFSRQIQDVFTDIAPYPGGDEKLCALDALAAFGEHLPLVPFATVPAADVPKIGTLQIDPTKKGALIKEPLAAGNILEVPLAFQGWNRAKNSLLIASWCRQPNIHVEARIKAWVMFDTVSGVPPILRGEAASGAAQDLIVRAAALTHDLAKNL